MKGNTHQVKNERDDHDDLILNQQEKKYKNSMKKDHKQKSGFL